tara:strand:- start:2450 stop:2779 length:330 start_codon:yes stop_codon:yes gene_type:complete
MTDKNIKTALVDEIRSFVTEAKHKATVAVNTTLTQPYWQIGQRIHQEVLGGERAEYGKQIIASLGQQLTQEFGRGWSSRNVAYMLQFYETLPPTGDCAHTVCTIELEPL